MLLIVPALSDSLINMLPRQMESTHHGMSTVWYVSASRSTLSVDLILIREMRVGGARKIQTRADMTSHVRQRQSATRS